MNRVRLALAACALLLVTACDSVPYSDAAQRVESPPARSAGQDVASAVPTRPNQYQLGEHLTVTVSTPRSFTPTEAAYPHSSRAVAFELIIDNKGRTAYQPSQLSVTAMCNGATARQLVDSTQGYTGYVGAAEEVEPGQHVRVVVAFAVAAEPSQVQLMVQPDTTAAGRVTVFEGTV